MIFFNFAFKTGMPGGDDAAESPEKSHLCRNYHGRAGIIVRNRDLQQVGAMV